MILVSKLFRLIAGLQNPAKPDPHARDIPPRDSGEYNTPMGK